jgi:general secretion pathway protein B
MSFILDALRKSENERQRGAVPGIAHVSFAIPRHRLPTWALTVIVMLGVSVVALAGAWWQSTRSERGNATVDSATTIEVPIAVPAQGASRERVATEPLPPTPSARPTLPLANVVGRDPDGAREAASARTDTPPALDEAPSGVAADAVGATTATRAAPAARPTLPSAAALAAEGVTVPDLRLDLHVYHKDRPQDRLVIVNGSRYREGETLREGPRVVAIDPTGAVLTYLGRDFLLSPE